MAGEDDRQGEVIADDLAVAVDPGLHVHDVPRHGLQHVCPPCASEKYCENPAREGFFEQDQVEKIIAAMAWTGHLTDSTFRRYDITNEEDLKLAGERLSRFLGPQKREDC